MSRILIVEDEQHLADGLRFNLEAEGYSVQVVDSGEAALDLLPPEAPFDVVVLDVMLPGIDGFTVMTRLRQAGQFIPTLMLTARGHPDDVLLGFEAGADDYLTKPFHKDELVARIHAIVRRSKGHAQSVIITGDLTVNLDQKTVEVDGARVHLTGKEYQMLELLSLRKGTTLTKEMFLNHLYGGMDEPELKIIDVFICKLRKKLAVASGGRNYIETVWGRGYVLREPSPNDDRITA